MFRKMLRLHVRPRLKLLSVLSRRCLKAFRSSACEFGHDAGPGSFLRIKEHKPQLNRGDTHAFNWGKDAWYALQACWSQITIHPDVSSCPTFEPTPWVSLPVMRLFRAVPRSLPVLTGSVYFQLDSHVQRGYPQVCLPVRAHFSRLMVLIRSAYARYGCHKLRPGRFMLACSTLFLSTLCWSSGASTACSLKCKPVSISFVGPPRPPGSLTSLAS